MNAHAGGPPGERFEFLLLRHRGRTRLTQRDLAARLGVHSRSIQDWEAGVSYPSAERLQGLISALLELGGLTVGHEVEEAQALWAAAERPPSRMRTPFDSLWFAQLLAERVGRLAAPQAPRAVEESTSDRRQDWGEAPDVLGFVGRAEELHILRGWVLDGRCRLVAVLGMGGIGKTSLSAKLAQEVAPSFERVYWRGLRDAPPISDWLAGAIGFLSDQQVVPPAAESERLAAVLQLLRARHCLLVLDNFETLFEPGQREGRYRAGLEGYGRLLESLAEAMHQSCLIVTSRETPPELAVLSGEAVRTFQLSGLGVDEARVLLAPKQLAGTSEHWAELVARFGGNGLALKVVGESIRELFGGDIGGFIHLEEAGIGSLFGGMRRLLSEQVERSSAHEQQVLRVLAVEREPVRLGDLLPALAQRADRGAVLEGVEALRRRSLIERAETPGPAAFTLQSVVLEYVTDRLVEEVSDEIDRGEPLRLVAQPLIKAQAKEYVRQTQERLIGETILQQLEVKTHGGSGAAEQRLLALLEGWRGRPADKQGYGPGNVVNLLRLLRGDLRGLDLSRLAIRQAYLAEVDAQGASLAGANLADIVLAEAFDFLGSVALSRNGALLAGGMSSGEVWLWRVEDRTSLWVVQAHTGAVWGLSVSADGQLLASGGQDGGVRLWETSSGRPLALLDGHTGTVWNVALSADGQLLASGAADGTARLWQTSTGRQLASLEGHAGTVWAVALSADGELLASGGADATVRLWETSTGRQLVKLEGHVGAVYSVSFSEDAQFLASGGADGTVRLWNPRSGQALANLEGHAGGVWGVALSADGQFLVSGGALTVRLWETSTARLLATLPGHTNLIRAVAVRADGQLVASGSTDGTVRLWEGGTGRPLATLQGRTGGVWAVALSADGQLLASGRADGRVHLWETANGQLLATLHGHAGTVWGVAVSRDRRLVASSGADGMVRLWDAHTADLIATLEGHTSTVRAVMLSADSRLLVSGGEDGVLRLWDTTTGKTLTTLRGHAGTISCVAISDDAHLLASGGEDGTLRLWDPTAGRAVATLNAHTAGVWSVALSADGHLLASSGGGDGIIQLWDTSSAQSLAALQSDMGGVWSVALSADGSILAAGGGDGTVQLYQAVSAEPKKGPDEWRLVATLPGHTGMVFSMAMSADGRVVASGSFDGTAKLWDPRSVSVADSAGQGAKAGASLRTLQAESRYERMDITGLTGITNAQRAALLALGAVEHEGPDSESTSTTAPLSVP